MGVMAIRPMAHFICLICRRCKGLVRPLLRIRQQHRVLISSPDPFHSSSLVFFLAKHTFAAFVFQTSTNNASSPRPSNLCFLFAFISLYHKSCLDIRPANTRTNHLTVATITILMTEITFVL